MQRQPITPHPNSRVLNEGDKINLEEAPRYLKAMQHLYNGLAEQKIAQNEQESA